MILHVLRGLTLVLVAAIAALFLLNNQESWGIGFPVFVVMLLVALGAVGVIVAVDMFFRDKRLSSISGVFLGILVGLVVAWPGWIIVDLFADITAPQITVPLPNPGPASNHDTANDTPDNTDAATNNTSSPMAAIANNPGNGIDNAPLVTTAPAPDNTDINPDTADDTADEALASSTPPNGPGTLTARQALIKRQTEDHNAEVAKREAYFNLCQGVKVILGIISCYIAISLIVQTKDDFRFVIPYVEFSKQLRGNRPTILDTSAVIDGRIVEIINTRILQGTLILPRFMLNELQLVADSADRLKRTRGRRGLDMLAKIQATAHIEVHIDETDVEGTGVDQKLIALAEEKRARLLTLDFNLNKVASLRGVDVINLNDLATALKPVALPGEVLTVKLIKAGESPNQGVGYLDDGTMVVIENGRTHLNHVVDAEVTSTLQTSAGRMIFARFLTEPPETAAPGSEAPVPQGGHGTENAATFENTQDTDHQAPPQADAPTKPSQKNTRRHPRNPRRKN